jgi:hypothetical protein
MNTDIANIILEEIKDLAWVDKYAGLVRVAVKGGSDPLKPIKKFFPIACNVTVNDCITAGTLNDLIPDSKYKSILYFEDNTVQLLGMESGYINMRSNLRLVCWLNGKMLGYDGCSLSSVAVLGIVKALNGLLINPFNSGVYTKIRISAVSQEPKSQAIFSKYSYDESVNQYLIPPFDYFALNIITNFSVSVNCLTDFEERGPSEC